MKPADERCAARGMAAGSRFLLALPITLVLGVGGCAGRAGPPDLDGLPIVPEQWTSPYDAASDLDSPAYWSDPAGSWVIVTAKGTDDLWVFDASTGDLLRRVGEEGDAPGQFDRPNGIAVVGDLLLVVERDNDRVQALSLPSFEPLGSFGQDALEFPYGITYVERDEGALDLYVTDDYGNELDLPFLPPFRGDITRRVKHFRLRNTAPGAAGTDAWGSDNLEPGQLKAELVRTFGEPRGAGSLRVVESIGADPDAGLLLIADEHDFALEAYDLEGTYLDRTVAGDLYAHGDPEGVALYRCEDGGGYWILTDQGKQRTVFHLLDRRTLDPVGGFAGATTANTDGIWLTQDRVAGVGDAALFALHDDGGLSAFAWSDIASALALRTGCEG